MPRSLLHRAWRVYYRILVNMALAIAIVVHLIAASADPHGAGAGHFLVLMGTGLVLCAFIAPPLAYLLGKDFDP